MNENFKTLIQSLDLRDIKIIDSHETVYSFPNPEDKTKVSIKTDQLFPNDDPKIKDETVVFRPKYIFTFSIENDVFYKAEYILLVSFFSKDVNNVEKLLADEDLKKIFLGQQLNRTLWSILRGVVMDGFNKHSINPVILPWIK